MDSRAWLASSSLSQPERPQEDFLFSDLRFRAVLLLCLAEFTDYSVFCRSSEELREVSANLFTLSVRCFPRMFTAEDFTKLRTSESKTLEICECDRARPEALPYRTR